MGTLMILAALLWGLGWLLGAPLRLRLAMLAGLYVAVVLLHLVLPSSAPLRQATGGSAGPWLVLGGVLLMVLAYSHFLTRLRRRAAPVTPASDPGTFSESELNRYARHIVLREVGGPGQKRLKQARVLVVGAGGLGAPSLQYLAAAGVGTIGVIDDDAVDNSNLQRQVIHRDRDIGMPKVHSAAAAMQAQNPHVAVRPYHRRLSEDVADDLFADYDLILDGSDNAETRYLVNRIAVAQAKPLVSGALSQWEGQISVFDPARGAPCYACLFPDPVAAGLAPSCAEAGVIAPLPGVIGAMMALEALKLITGAGTPMRGQMLIYDGLFGETRTIAVARDPQCAVCGGAAETPNAGRDNAAAPSKDS